MNSFFVTIQGGPPKKGLAFLKFYISYKKT